MKDKATILVIDDDRALSSFVVESLQRNGYKVSAARDGQAGLRRFYEQKPDLVVLDVNMPGMDGWTTCQRIREISDTPIIMLTAQSRPDSIVKGLDLGADDYLIKPFEIEVLLARVRANLRRHLASQPVAQNGTAYADDFLSINLDERRVLRGGDALKLTKTEFDLLAELVRASPRVATYRHLLENVWGFEYIDDIDYLRVYVWHLRRKIEVDPKKPTYILNVQGVGYRFQRR